ncbi:hypothetical protein GCM10018953_10230 [Streptosporangium nondiastaticum]
MAHIMYFRYDMWAVNGQVRVAAGGHVEPPPPRGRPLLDQMRGPMTGPGRRGSLTGRPGGVLSIRYVSEQLRKGTK